MRKKLNKMIKMFFALGMIFSQLYSPLSVFAEVIEDTKSDVTDNDIDDSTTNNDVTDVNTFSEEDNDNNSEEVVPLTIDNTDNSTEVQELSVLDYVKVNGSFSDISDNSYTVDSSSIDKNVTFECLDSTKDIRLTINDSYVLTDKDDFSFDFGKLLGGSYKFTLELYENDTLVSSEDVTIIYNSDTSKEDYFKVDNNTTVEDLAYMYLSATLDDGVDTGKLLGEYLTLNSDLGMKFDSENGIITGIKGSTNNRVTTVGEICNDINMILDSTEVSSDTTIVGTGTEINITFMDNTYKYVVAALGDVDGDRITDSDVNSIIDFSIGKATASLLITKASDINADDVADIADVTNVIKVIKTDSFDVDSNNNDQYTTTINGDSEARVGDRITVNFDVTGFTLGTINGISGTLNYDNTMLELVASNSSMFEFGSLNLDNNKFMFATLNGINSDSTVKVLNTGDASVNIDDIKLADNGKILNVLNNSTSKNLTLERALDSNNNISEIKVSTGTLDKEINDDDTYYVITVGSGTTNIDIDGVLTSEYSEVSGFGNYTLAGDHTIIQIKVTAENGEVKEYTFEVVREQATTTATEDNNSSDTTDTAAVSTAVNYVVNTVKYSSDSLLDNLIIEGYEINFSRDKYEYTITVGSDVNSLNIKALLSDMDASYAVYGNGEFKEGENTVRVVVTAEDGSTSTYTITVNKEKAKATTSDKDKDKEEAKSNGVVKTIVIILIILVIIGLIYLIFKDDSEDDEEYSPKNKPSNKKKK